MIFLMIHYFLLLTGRVLSKFLPKNGMEQNMYYLKNVEGNNAEST
jgi:hypothetical protein